jgi:hypothetical protein
MNVTLRTLDPDSEECLGGVLRELQRILLELIVVRRGILEVRSGAGEELPGDLVDRHVLRELRVQPGVIA